MAARRIQSPREKYGDVVKKDVFGTEFAKRTPAWLSRETGISAATLRGWRLNPGKMPAYRYLQLMELIRSGNIE